MAIICWGNLAKSADDTLRIEQSIEDYVEGHNENVNAHQVYGSSLYMHRIQTELDHRFGSVDLRYLASTKVLMMSVFESGDGWSKTGTFAPSILAAALLTGTGSGDWGVLYNEPSPHSLTIDFSKNPFFQTSLLFNSDSDQHAWFGCGDANGDYGQDSFGFKIVNGNLYAFTRLAGVEHYNSISGIDITEAHVYRAEMRSADSEIDFYVDGVLKHTEVDDIPSGSTDPLFMYALRTDIASQKKMYISDLLFMQDR